ncbi:MULTISPECIES: tyrosine-type recombinase/integrase [Microbacterium]|uniref:tyrosine-type recombinase/integrase n=1 Tax=Microbacterium TaxID=33882 RepID=UPI0025F15A47|nr:MULTISPECIES: tyrosine-type recombinase/integrase [Microbacterium]
MSQLTAKPNLRSNMHLRFVDRRFPATSAADDLTREAYASMGSLPEGLPILLDDRWRPVEPWLTYFRVVGATTDRSTIRNYGYDAHRFASYLDSRGTDVVHANTEDIRAYREWRLRESSRPISPSTWRREVVVIRGIFQLLTQTGVLQREPWITIGRTSVLSHRWYSEPDIRPLTRSQWETFRDIGLSGRDAKGSLDPSWRGQTPLRSRAGAELAITTGMRVSEFSTLLDAELPTAAVVGASVLLEACAKYQKRRRVSVPVSTLRTVDLYRQTERRSIARRSAASLWNRRSELFVVDEVDAAAGMVRGRKDGRRSTWRMHLLPPQLRRIAVRERDGGLEALGLFLGRGGLPISLRAWHASFEAATQRTLDLAPEQLGGRRARITPHDLRHTFAVIMLRGLMDVALARESDRRAGAIGPATLSEHISINPRLTVQRLLGHSNPATTMIYLRFIEDTDALVQNVFESWNDETVSLAEAVVADRSRA